MAPAGKKSTFTRFPDLPVELRLTIWSFALPGPRTVIVGLQNQGGGEVFREREYDPDAGIWPEGEVNGIFTGPIITGPSYDFTDKFAASAKPPAMLGVCCESREVASKVYHLCFVKRCQNLYQRQKGSGIFVNPKIDTIQLVPHCGYHHHHLFGSCSRYAGYSFGAAMTRYDPSSVKGIENVQVPHSNLLFPGTRYTNHFVDRILDFFPAMCQLELNIPKSRGTTCPSRETGVNLEEAIHFGENIAALEPMRLRVRYQVLPVDISVGCSQISMQGDSVSYEVSERNEYLISGHMLNSSSDCAVQ